MTFEETQPSRSVRAVARLVRLARPRKERAIFILDLKGKFNE
jgi:hypothetical protein